MAMIKKNGRGRWRVQVHKLGVRNSGTFDTKRKAQEWATKREFEIISAGGAKLLHKNTTLEELFDRYTRTVSIHKGGKTTEEKRLYYFASKHPSISDLVKDNTKASDVTKADIAHWRDERLKVVKPATVLREKNLLCNVFTKALEWEIIDRSPFKNLKWPAEPERRERPISQSEIDRLIFHLDNWDRQSKPASDKQKVAAMFLFAIETAMRQGEIKYLEKSELFLDRRVIRLAAGRTKERRKKAIGLSTEAVRILKICQSDTKFWFDANKIYISACITTAKRKAGIDDLVFHDTRHEGITRLADRLTPFELARQVGHKNLSELDTYYEKQADQFAYKLG